MGGVLRHRRQNLTPAQVWFSAFVAALVLLTALAANSDPMPPANSATPPRPPNPTPTPTPTPAPPVITMTAGQPVTFDFNDGRVAVVKTNSVTFPGQISIGFQITDNTCNGNQGMQCQYFTGYRQKWYFLAWLRHPDASKIGQIVNLVNGQSPLPIDFSSQFSGLERDFTPVIDQGMPATAIQCDDFSWLPGGAKTPPANLKVARWDNELMLTNAEDALAENRSSAGSQDLELRGSGNQLQVTKVGAFTGPTVSFLVIGMVATMSIPDSTGNICQVTLTPGGLGAIINQITLLARQRPDPSKETQLYLFGSDEVSYELQHHQTIFGGQLPGFFASPSQLNWDNVK